MAKQRYKDPLIIAVTGGIGSGQSTVCKFFEEWGCKVINADLKAKEVIQKDKKLQRELRKTFGGDIFFDNGQLNTKRLAELAFRNELEIQKLNQLVHPRMVESLIEEMEHARFSGKYPMVIIDAALVYEISIEKMFDAVIVVDAPLPLRQQRVKDREGMTRKQFKERVDRQIPLEDKVKWADFVIKNDGTLDELKERSRQVFEKLMRMRTGKKKVS